MFQKISTFFKEVRQEIAKVSWPTRDELKGSTAIVIILTLVFSIFIYGVDKILGELIKILYPYE
jgi:preprotein translocase subunit SecE